MRVVVVVVDISRLRSCAHQRIYDIVWYARCNGMVLEVRFVPRGGGGSVRLSTSPPPSVLLVLVLVLLCRQKQNTIDVSTRVHIFILIIYCCVSWPMQYSPKY